MGKNKSGGNASLGRSLMKDRSAKNKGRKMVSDNSMLHSTEIQDGYEWGRLNLQSVTEESSFQEFLSTAELAGTEFQAEKLNIKFVNPRSNVGLLSGEEMKTAKEAHDRYKKELKIPRRPPWNCETTPDDLNRNEKEHFLEWRRSLARLQEEQGLLLTPYEKNIEFWRQLWRVVERSDVVVQIVDARNPLLFQCEDLEKYVKEISEHKMNLILVNKADFLTDRQREHWSAYFSSVKIQAVFFSAHLASENSVQKEDDKQVIVSKDDRGDDENVEEYNNRDDTNGSQVLHTKELVKQSITNLEQAVDENADALNRLINRIEEIIGIEPLNKECVNQIANSSNLLNREELIELFRTIHKGPKVTKDVTTIGLVGYPNVGKSSTINALLSSKKVSVSATPGKTKHFQTLYLDKDILLCDCPGLVMPSFVFTKAEMILNGILPIDQMRDHVPPTNLVTNLIPRHVIEEKYSIMLPLPMEGEIPDRSPTAEELLNAYAYNRGFMTANGQPDNSRAARYILKDYMNGKLLYCQAPPTVDQHEYHTWPERQKIQYENRILPPRALRAIKPSHTTAEDVDTLFFKPGQEVHVKGVFNKSTNISHSGLSPQSGLVDSMNVEKPWKQYNKHKNKAKKEKLRRVYAHLDQH